MDAGILKKKKTPVTYFRKLAMVNKPLCVGALRQRLVNDLAMARVGWSPEEFVLVKELIAGMILFITFGRRIEGNIVIAVDVNFLSLFWWHQHMELQFAIIIFFIKRCSCNNKSTISFHNIDQQ